MSCVPEASVSWSTVHEVQLPGRRAGPGQRRGDTVGEGERRRRRVRLRQVPLGGLRHPGGGEIADVAVGAAQHQRARPGTGRAVDPGEVQGRALGAALRLGVAGDAQAVVEQHHAGGVDLARVQQLGRGPPGRRSGCRGSPRPGPSPRGGPRPRGRGAAAPGPRRAGRARARRRSRSGPRCARRWGRPGSACRGRGRPRRRGSRRRRGRRRRPGPSRRPAGRPACRTPRGPRRRRGRPWCAGGGASDRWAGPEASTGRTRGGEQPPAARGTPFAEASAPPGSATPAAFSSSRTSGSGSCSRPRRT